MDETTLNRFAVIGNPVAQSMSPYIHQNFASQFGIDLSYEKMHVAKDNFQQIVLQFFAEGGCGLNITTPFKSQAAKIVSNCSKIAKASNSVNTIFINDKGELQGESTDGQGWLTDMHRHNVDIANKNILVIGAGGAARVIVNTLLMENVQLLHVCNRTEERAKNLLKTGLQQETVFTASGLDDIPDIEWDLLINCLSVGWQGTYPDVSTRINNSTAAYDLNYGNGATSFRRWFLDTGGRGDCFYDGWGMLVEQAAVSFNHWWDLRPETDDLIKAGHLSTE